MVLFDFYLNTSKYYAFEKDSTMLFVQLPTILIYSIRWSYHSSWFFRECDKVTIIIEGRALVEATEDV